MVFFLSRHVFEVKRAKLVKSNWVFFLLLSRRLSLDENVKRFCLRLPKICNSSMVFKPPTILCYISEHFHQLTIHSLNNTVQPFNHSRPASNFIEEIPCISYKCVFFEFIQIIPYLLNKIPFFRLILEAVNGIFFGK